MCTGPKTSYMEANTQRDELGMGFVFDAEILGLILAMEYAVSNNWTRLWLESDSSNAV